jgi:hypothetical protein
MSENIECDKILYTIDDIDELCVDAQRKLIKNEIFQNTNLYKILQKIKNEEIYLWYSDEINDLNETKTFDELIKNIEKSLQEGAGEVYIHYKIIV